MNTDETPETSRNGDVRPRFLVTLEREVMVWQCQEAEIEVEAADEAEAMRKAPGAFDDDEIDHDDWEAVEGGSPWQSIEPPSASSVGAVSDRWDVDP